jgi:serine protease Do
MDSSKNAGSLWTRLRSGRLNTAFALLTVLTVGILAGSLITGSVSAKQQKVDSSDARPIVIPNPVTLSNGFSTIVKQVGPAVVNIDVESIPKAPAAHGRNGMQRGPVPQQPQDPDDNNGDQGNMQDFFNRFFGGGGGGQTAPDAGPRRALGSGFIVDNRGYIITNNHVVDKADHIYVKLASDPDDPANIGRPATVVGVDKDTAHGKAWQLGRRAGRRLGTRHWQPVRSLADRIGGHREREEPHDR